MIDESSERDCAEVAFSVILGSALMATLGPAQFLEEWTGHERLGELAEKVDDPGSVCSALHGVWQAYTTGAVDHGRAADVARQMLSVGERYRSSQAVFQGRRCLGSSLFFKGLLEQAHSEYDLAMRSQTTHEDDTLKYSFDLIASGKSVWSVAHWVSGHVDLSKELASEAIERARATNNLHTESFVLHYACNVLCTLRREFDLVAETTRKSIEFSTDCGFPHWLAMAKILRGTASVLSATDPSACELANDGLAELEGVGWRLFRSFFLSVAAAAHAFVGDIAAAKARLREAHECDRHSDERWAEAEIWRIDGEVLLLQRQVDEAEVCYRRAIDIAQRRQAKSWELRAATSLARLWGEQGERHKAHDLLAPVYGWFTEGFDTADLKDAKALLDDLA